MTKQGDNYDGMLLRGADGKLYLIPDTELQQFRVPEDRAGAFDEFYDRATGTPETAGFGLNAPGGLSFPLAVHGAFRPKEPQKMITWMYDVPEWN